MTSTSRVVTNYVRVLSGNVRGEDHRDSASPDVAFCMQFTQFTHPLAAAILLNGEVTFKLITLLM